MTRADGSGRRSGPVVGNAGSALSREAIVAVAVNLADESGLDSISARRIAGELGVSPMALYRHVGSKDDILEAVVDELLARLPLPDAGHWPDGLRVLATGLRQVFLEHQATLELYLRRPVTSAAARARLGFALEMLTAGGFEEVDACRAYAAVHSYTLGYCALEAARARSSGVAPAGEDPGDDGLASKIRSFVSEGQFERGLEAMLDGLAIGRRANGAS